MRVAQLQTHVLADKGKNLDEVEDLLCGLDGRGVDLACLGEMFCCPYETPNFPTYAEPVGGPTWQRLSSMAERHQVVLAAGSVPEVDEAGHVYNTAYVFGSDGNQLARHRKMHLFDVEIPGGQVFHESETLTAGSDVTVFDTALARMGLCICFDCRFPELTRLMALEGAQIILVPAAFNLSTGPAHWELLHRSNALMSQAFVVATSDARDMLASYHAWGHSMLVGPWGDVRAQLDDKPGVLVTDIDLSDTAVARGAIPALSARRSDVYELRLLKGEI